MEEVYLGSVTFLLPKAAREKEDGGYSRTRTFGSQNTAKRGNPKSFAI
jgi:hypothetical protein